MLHITCGMKGARLGEGVNSQSMLTADENKGRRQASAIQGTCFLFVVKEKVDLIKAQWEVHPNI